MAESLKCALVFKRDNRVGGSVFDYGSGWVISSGVVTPWWTESRDCDYGDWMTERRVRRLPIIVLQQALSHDTRGEGKERGCGPLWMMYGVDPRLGLVLTARKPENEKGEEGHAWIMLMWVVTAVKKPTKGTAASTGLIATNNKVIITPALQTLTGEELQRWDNTFSEASRFVWHLVFLLNTFQSIISNRCHYTWPLES